jgi:hypothetical protein
MNIKRNLNIQITYIEINFVNYNFRLLPWLIDTYQIDEFDKKYLTSIMRKNIEQHKDVKDLDTLSK